MTLEKVLEFQDTKNLMKRNAFLYNYSYHWKEI